MTRCIYVNGRYAPYAEAAIHAEDRGFQFGDGVYEVIEVRGGRLVDPTRHLDRLSGSLTALMIAAPMSRGCLMRVFAEVIARNRVSSGILYLQVTRGAAARDFALPNQDHPATVVCLARAMDFAKVDARARVGIAVKTMADNRWGRCDLKTVMLLPAVLAKQAAKAAGAQDAWFVDRDGFVTEGASNNAWIVTKAGELVTRPLGHDILPGVTRATVMDVARELQLKVIERPFTVADALGASEAFVTSATTIVMPVVQIDGQPVGEGKPGAVAARLRAAFHAVAEMGGV